MRVFIGAGVLGLFVYQNASSPGRERVLGRFLFYALYARVGV